MAKSNKRKYYKRGGNPIYNKNIKPIRGSTDIFVSATNPVNITTVKPIRNTGNISFPENDLFDVANEERQMKNEDMVGQQIALNETIKQYNQEMPPFGQECPNGICTVSGGRVYKSKIFDSKKKRRNKRKTRKCKRKTRKH